MKEQDAAHSEYTFTGWTRTMLENELTRLRSELQQERELRKELVEAVEKLLRVDSFRGGFPYTTKVFESVIQKTKLNN